MINLVPPKKIVVKSSSGRGLGCFAVEKIHKDEIFEESYLLNVSNDTLVDFMFKYPKKNHTHHVIPLGFGCIYNHNDSPNANWREHPLIDPSICQIFQFYALRDIEIDEEIFIYYGGESYWSSRSHVKLV